MFAARQENTTALWAIPHSLHTLIKLQNIIHEADRHISSSETNMGGQDTDHQNVTRQAISKLTVWRRQRYLLWSPNKATEKQQQNKQDTQHVRKKLAEGPCCNHIEHSTNQQGCTDTARPQTPEKLWARSARKCLDKWRQSRFLKSKTQSQYCLWCQQRVGYNKTRRLMHWNMGKQIKKITSTNLKRI